MSYTSPFIRLIKRALGTSHIPIKISLVSSIISNFHTSTSLTTKKHQNHLCGAGVAPLVQLWGYGVRLPATAEIYRVTTAFIPIRCRPPSLISLGHRKLLCPVVRRPDPEAACFRQCSVKVTSLWLAATSSNATSFRFTFRLLQLVAFLCNYGLWTH